MASNKFWDLYSFLCHLYEGTELQMLKSHLGNKQCTFAKQICNHSLDSKSTNHFLCNYFSFPSLCSCHQSKYFCLNHIHSELVFPQNPSYFFHYLHSLQNKHIAIINQWTPIFICILCDTGSYFLISCLPLHSQLNIYLHFPACIHQFPCTKSDLNLNLSSPPHFSEVS